MIVLDIPMPKNCHDCPCWDYEECECQIVQEEEHYPAEVSITSEYRLTKCPIVGEVEKWNGIHGHVIALKGTFDKIYEDAEEDEYDI